MGIYERFNGVACDRMVRIHELKIKAGHDIDTKISNGNTAPLWTEKIAVIMQIEGPRIPLVEACYYRNVQAVEVLLSNGADPNRFISGGFSPLEAAIVYGHVDESSLAIVRLLLEHGADPNKFGSESPLLFKLSTFLAAGNHDSAVTDMILLLLEYGADNYWNGYNKVAFDIVKSCDVPLASAYFEANRNAVNETNPSGQSLLMAALISNENSDYTDIVNLLLQHGIDRHITDNDGRTAYDYAIQYKLYDIAENLS